MFEKCITRSNIVITYWKNIYIGILNLFSAEYVWKFCDNMDHKHIVTMVNHNSTIYYGMELW